MPSVHTSGHSDRHLRPLQLDVHTRLSAEPLRDECSFATHRIHFEMFLMFDRRFNGDTLHLNLFMADSRP